jgi:hypothetical protein
MGGIMKFKMNKKGFFFTLSVILFATTLFAFTQAYSEKINSRSSLISELPKRDIALFINRTISEDLQQILDFELDTNFNPYAEISFRSYFPYSYSVSTELSTYSNIVDSNLFDYFYGTSQLSLSDLSDGTAEIFFPDGNIEINYTNNEYSFSHTNISEIQINLISQNDLNSATWSASSGSTNIRINYADDTNYFSITDSISLSSESILTLIENNDSNIYLTFSNNTINLNSDDQNKLTYFVKSTLNSDYNYFPIKFNSLLQYSNPKIDSNSWIKIR